MTTKIGRLTGKMVSSVCNHFGVELEDLDDMPSEISKESVAEIEKSWHGFSHDLSHLSRDEQRLVLQRAKPYQPEVIDGCEVRLYDDLQVQKGQQRVKAVVIDLGDARFIQIY